MSSLNIALSTNGNLIDKIRPAYSSSFAHGFENKEVSLEELEQIIKSGTAISYQYRIDHRTKENFARTGFLAVDMDGAREIDECLEDPIVKQYGSLFYTTPSHSAERHRFRIVFALESPITNAKDVSAAAKSLSGRLTGDMTVTEAARIFYGSSMGETRILGNVMPDEFVQQLIKEGKEAPISDSISDDNRPTSRRATTPMEPDQRLATRTGRSVTLAEITKKTSVFCPFHHDRKASAFVGLNNFGSRYLYCAACGNTWWERAAAVTNIDFGNFEQTLRDIHDGKVEAANRELNPLEKFLDLDADPPKNIYLTENEFFSIERPPKGLLLIKSPKGSGKTTFLSKVISGVTTEQATLRDYDKKTIKDTHDTYRSKDSVLLIGHRQALIGDLCKRLRLNSYLDDENYSGQEIGYRK
jgi:hypothetical protein